MVSRASRPRRKIESIHGAATLANSGRVNLAAVLSCGHTRQWPACSEDEAKRLGLRLQEKRKEGRPIPCYRCE